MSYYETVVLHKLRELSRLSGGVVRCQLIADHLGQNARTVRYKLVSLERRGLVIRIGQRGGWKPTRKVG